MSSSPLGLFDVDRAGFEHAFRQAVEGAKEGGIPIGSALVLQESESGSDDVGRAGRSVQTTVLGVGRNQRVQRGSAVLHAEIAALDDAGRCKAEVYRRSTIVRSFTLLQQVNDDGQHNSFGL